MADERKNALTEFVRSAQTLRGDEKSEAQIFLDHFFRALGHDGVIEAGATFEFRVAKKPGSPQLELIKGNGAPARSKGGKKFADCHCRRTNSRSLCRKIVSKRLGCNGNHIQRH